MSKLKFNSGSEMNFSGKSTKGKFTLHGDPTIKIEKPLTAVHFPGGHIEISRTSNNEYWAHISVHRPDSPGALPSDMFGEVVDARIDARGHYPEQKVMEELSHVEFEHIAIRIRTTKEPRP